MNPWAYLEPPPARFHPVLVQPELDRQSRFADLVAPKRLDPTTHWAWYRKYTRRFPLPASLAVWDAVLQWRYLPTLGDMLNRKSILLAKLESHA